MAGRKERPKRPEPPPPPTPTVHRATQAALIDLLCADALKNDWGDTFTVIGARGKGKTYFMQRLADHLAAKVDVVMVHDQKDPRPQYAGAVRGDFSRVAADPPTDTNVLVFHRNYPPPVHPEEIAAKATELARTGVSVAVIVDELRFALDGRQSWRDGVQGPTALGLCFWRSNRVWYVAGTQIPQALPTELLDLSSAVVVFGIDGRSAGYLDRTENLGGAAAAVVSGLQRGECIVLIRGTEWNGTIYGPT